MLEPTTKENAMKTYTVAVDAHGETLFALRHGPGWTELRGMTGHLDEATKDRAIADAMASGMDYDVLEHDGDGARGVRIEGTAHLIED